MSSIIQDVIEIKAVVIAVWLILFFLMERLVPAVRTPSDVNRRVVRNMALFAINIVLSPLIVLPVTAWAAGYGLIERPGWWYGLPGFALDLLILDFWIYWWHRANHVLPFLWRFHVVHHYDRYLDSTSALRFHFGEVVLSALARAAFIVLLGFPFQSVVVFEILVLLASIFHHSSVKLPEGFERILSKVIVTPSIHWVHHHAIRQDTDSNYATILSIWDPIFRSRSKTLRTADLEIGVEGTKTDKQLLSLLLAPFRR